MDMFQVWQPYLAGSLHRTIVHMDHWNLEYWSKARHLNAWQGRWALFLSQFQPNIKYMLGALQAKADALSSHSEHKLAADAMAHCQGDICKLIPEEHIEPQIIMGAVALLLVDAVTDGHRHMVVVDAEERLELLRKYHNAPLTGHFSVTETYVALSHNYIWCEIKHDVAHYV